MPSHTEKERAKQKNKRTPFSVFGAAALLKNRSQQLIDQEAKATGRKKKK